MTVNVTEFTALITVVVSAINIFVSIYFSWKRAAPEVKKLEAEGESEIVDAAHINLEGAKLSSEMLMARIEDLKAQLETERASRKADVEYLRRRIRESEREARDYRVWAARLAKQVIEAGKQPVQFESSYDSDPVVTAITKEQIEADKASKKG